MRSVRRDESEVSSSFWETIDFRNKKLGNIIEFSREHVINERRGIDAVDNHCRITCIGCALAVRRDDSLVILDRGFGARAADDADCLHRDFGVAEKSTKPRSGSVDKSVTLILSPTSSPC